MISLRDYQAETVYKLRQSVMAHKRSLLVAATGSGKTRMALRVMQGARQQGRTAWFIVHRRELCKQTAKAMWEADLEHGMIMAGRAQSQLPLQVGTVLTCVKRIDKLKDKPDIIIIDEAHRAVSSSYLKILEKCPDAIVIGLTATPERTDGRGLGEIFNDMVETKSMGWLIENGYLSDYKLIAPPTSGVDLSGIKTIAGDYDQKELQKRMDKPTITGDAITAYKKHILGKRCMVFCVTVAHSEHVCDQYNQSGVPAEHIDGTYSDSEREAALNRFREGKTLVLCTVQLAIEGLDIPAVEAVQMLRPTKSVIVYLQIIGRGLRPEKNKEFCYILDHCENWQRPRFGLPDSHREWSLEAKPKGKRKKQKDEDDIDIQSCPKCYAIFKKGNELCPQCGHKLPVFDRTPEAVAGDLVEIDIEAAKRERRMAQGKARTLDELINLGISREMKKPAHWAAITHAARAGKKASPQDFTEARRAYARIRNSEKNNVSAF